MKSDDEQFQELLRVHKSEQTESSMSSVARTLATYRDACEFNGFTRDEAMELVHAYHDWMLSQAGK